MTVNHLYCLITMEKKTSLSECQHSSLFGLIEILLIGFFRWVSFPQKFFSQKKKKTDLEFQSSIKHEETDDLCREDAELVMRSLGLVTELESEGLQKQYTSKELLNLFEEKEPSLEEVKQAFDVFDENRDGFIDPIDLQRVLTILGLNQGSDLETCSRMIRSFDGNRDGRIDFHGFVKFMENHFC